MKAYAYSNGAKLDQMIELETLVSGGRGGLLAKETLLRADARDAFLRMADDAWEMDKIVLRCNSGYRSYESQGEFWKAWLEGRLRYRPTRPGYSEHNLGVACDINRSHDDPDGDGPLRSKTDAWLDEHAARYGFRRTVPAEPWHWCYVGQPDDDGYGMIL